MSHERTSAASAIGQLGDRRGRRRELGERLVDHRVGRRAAVALGGVPGVVALRLVGDGGDELGGGTVVAGPGQRLRRWPRPP